MWYFYPTEGESINLDLQGDSPPPQFPRLVRYPDLPMRKTLRVVDLLSVMIFFQRKKITACKIKNEKEDIIFYFFMVLNLLKIIHPFESKKHLRLLWKLIETRIFGVLLIGLSTNSSL